MAGGPIVLRYNADVKSAVAGNEQLAESITQTADAAKDAETAASKSADATLSVQKRAAQQVIQATREAARQQVQEWERSALEQGRDADQVQRTVSEAYQKIEQDARQASQTIEQSTSSSWDKALQGVRDFRESVGSTLEGVGQALGSFDGSIGSVGTTISGLTALIPGVGGLIGGVLGGAATNMFNAWDKAAQDTENRIGAMYDDMIESGNNFLSESAIQTAIGDIVKDSEKFDDVKRRAEIAGISVQTALRAEAGDKSAIKEAIDAATGSLDRLKASGEGISSVPVRETQKVIDSYNGLSQSTDTAAQRAEIARGAFSNSAGTISQLGAAVNSLNEKIKQTPTTRDIRVTVTGADAVARQLDAITRDRTTYVTVKSRAGDRVF